MAYGYSYDRQLLEAYCFGVRVGGCDLILLDLSFAVNTLIQFMVEPWRVHWIAAKHVLRYIAGTVDYGLHYVKGDGVRLVGYFDSDWVGCASDLKSTSGCCFGLGSMIVSWFSGKQKSVALSSA